MAEKDVGKKFGDVLDLDFLVKNTPDRYGTGIPDRGILKKSNKRFAWVELKHIYQLPKKQCMIPLKPKQAVWLDDWKAHGGYAFVVVGVGNDKVALFSKNFRQLRRKAVKRDMFQLMTYEELAVKLAAEMDGE